MRLEPRFQIPDDPKEAIKALSERLRVLEDLVQKTTVAQTKLVTVEPAKPRDGMFAYADGVNWDPGAGRGLYQYVNGTWQPVSAPRPDQIPQTPWAQDVDAAGHDLVNAGELNATSVVATQVSAAVNSNSSRTLLSGHDPSGYHWFSTGGSVGEPNNILFGLEKNTVDGSVIAVSILVNGVHRIKVTAQGVLLNLPTSSAGLPSNALWVDTAAGRSVKHVA